MTRKLQASDWFAFGFFLKSFTVDLSTASYGWAIIHGMIISFIFACWLSERQAR